MILAVLSKGKLLLFGLSKVSTFSTMLLSIGAYWTIYGWPFAVGLVLSIYVHEMGHVYALRQFGFAASAPTFIPFVGAFVRMKQHPILPFEDARVGLAGPIWGTAAAIALFVAYYLTGAGVLGAIAHFAAWLNLFNLLPIWQLDGGRGMRALTRSQRIILICVIVATWVATREGFLIVLAALARVPPRDQGLAGRRRSKALWQFCMLDRRARRADGDSDSDTRSAISGIRSHIRPAESGLRYFCKSAVYFRNSSSPRKCALSTRTGCAA